MKKKLLQSHAAHRRASVHLFESVKRDIFEVKVSREGAIDWKVGDEDLYIWTHPSPPLSPADPELASDRSIDRARVDRAFHKVGQFPFSLSLATLLLHFKRTELQSCQIKSCILLHFGNPRKTTQQVPERRGRRRRRRRSCSSTTR